LLSLSSYNRYLTVAARAVRRSLKDDKRLVAERRGETDLRFTKWTVSLTRNSIAIGTCRRRTDADGNTAPQQNGKQGEPRSVVEANQAAMVEAAGGGQSA